MQDLDVFIADQGQENQPALNEQATSNKNPLEQILDDVKVNGTFLVSNGPIAEG